MFMPYARAALMLFLLTLGIALGAGLYESRIAAAHWLAQSPDGALHWDAAAAASDNVGVRFWALVTTGPLTLLTLVNLWIALRRAEGQLRHWWLAGALLALVERGVTLAYFVPAMIGLMEAVDSPQAVRDATLWLDLNYARHALILAAWFASMKAYALAQNVKRRVPAYLEPHPIRSEEISFRHQM